VTAPETGLEPVLAGEHAAVYGYGMAGAVLVSLSAPAALIGAARSGYDAHRESRDALNDVITSQGGQPPTPLPAYALPFPLTSAGSVVRFLAGLEDRLCGVAAAAVGSADLARNRLLAADVLSAAALRAVRLRLLAGAPPAKAVTPLPGLPGR
jgi:Domain of unknown function (DUF4439)